MNCWYARGHLLSLFPAIPREIIDFISLIHFEIATCSVSGNSHRYAIIICGKLYVVATTTLHGKTRPLRREPILLQNGIVKAIYGANYVSAMTLSGKILEWSDREFEDYFEDANLDRVGRMKYPHVAYPMINLPSRIIDFDQCGTYHAAMSRNDYMYVWGMTNQSKDGIFPIADPLNEINHGLVIRCKGIRALKCSDHRILVLIEGALWNYYFDDPVEGVVCGMTSQRVRVELNGRITAINCRAKMNMAIVSGNLAIWDIYQPLSGVTQSVGYDVFLDNSCECAYVRGAGGIHVVPWSWRNPYATPIHLPAGADVWMIAGSLFTRLFATSRGIFVMTTEEYDTKNSITIPLDVSDAISW